MSFRLWSIMTMGNMKRFSVFWIHLGWEPWLAMRPAQMIAPDGEVYKPLIFGLWYRTAARGASDEKTNAR